MRNIAGRVLYGACRSARRAFRAISAAQNPFLSSSARKYFAGGPKGTPAKIEGLNVILGGLTSPGTFYWSGAGNCPGQEPLKILEIVIVKGNLLDR